jgi:hypothetical protein
MKGPRRSQGSRAPSRSALAPGIVIRFVFRHFTQEVLARSLPHHPDSHAALQRTIISKKRPRLREELPRAEATRTSRGPPFWIMVRLFFFPFEFHGLMSPYITVRRAAPGHRDNKKKRKAEGQLSVSRVGRSRTRTDPYQAPYFFPSPMAPGASDYVRLVQHDRKPVLGDHAYTPMSTEGQHHTEDNVRSSLPSRGPL